MQKQMPGVSERSFLKSLELFSMQKGRVSITNSVVEKIILDVSFQFSAAVCTRICIEVHVFVMNRDKLKAQAQKSNSLTKS